MRFLRPVPCTYCGNTLAVPTRGEYRIQCSVCEGMNGTLPPPKPLLVTLQPPAILPEAPKTTPIDKEVMGVNKVSWDAKMKKEELLSLALSLGLDVSGKSTKKEIEVALRSYTTE